MGRIENGKLVIFQWGSSTEKRHHAETYTNNFEKQLPEWNNKLERFLFLFLTLGAKCGYRQESHKTLLFLAVCFPNERKTPDYENMSL